MTGVNLGGGSALDLSSLLKIVGSDSEYGKKIQDFIAAEQAAKNAMIELRAAQKEFDTSREQAKSDLAKLNAEKEAHQNLASEFSTHKTNQTAAFAEREARLRDMETALADKKSKHYAHVDQAAASLAERETAVSIRERDLAETQTKIERDSNRLNAKMRKIAEAEAL